MSVVELAVMPEADARRITERIRYTAMSVRDGVEKLQKLVAEAQEGQAHVALGYASWTAYLADVMGEEPLRLARDERREVVAWLSGEGMSTRAIAPIVGTSHMQVKRDVDASAGVTNVTPAKARVSNVNPEPAFEMRGDDADNVVADPQTGEVIDDEVGIPDTIDPLASRTVTGLDGKTYTRPEPKAPRAEAITSQFTSAIADLNRVMARLHRIADDNNFNRNRNQVAALHGNDLIRTISELEALADHLKGN